MRKRGAYLRPPGEQPDLASMMEARAESDAADIEFWRHASERDHARAFQGLLEFTDHVLRSPDAVQQPHHFPEPPEELLARSKG